MARRKFGDLVTSVDVLAELTWFYMQAESDLGVRSATGAALRRIELGSFNIGRDELVDDDSARRIRALHRYRRIERIMRGLTGEQRSCLNALHEPYCFEDVKGSAVLTHYFGDLVRLVVLMPATRALYRSWSGKEKSRERGVMQWLIDVLSPGSKEEKQDIRDLKTEAKQLALRAYAAYSKEREKCGAADLRLAA